MIVIDASVIATALGDDGDGGDRLRDRLRGEQLAAPHLLDVEVASVFRRQVAAGRLDPRRARLALDDLVAMPIRRAAHAPLLTRAWELRENLTSYDAIYVALAEALDVALVTGDARLARTRRLRCAVELVQ